MESLLSRLSGAPWAKRLLAAINEQAGVTYDTMPLLFEARVGHALNQARTGNEDSIGADFSRSARHVFDVIIR